MKKLIEAKRGTPVPKNAKYLFTEKRLSMGKITEDVYDVFEVPVKGTETFERKELSESLPIKGIIISEEGLKHLNKSKNDA